MHTAQFCNGSQHSLPDSKYYGWKWDIEMQLYDAVMTKLLPAPEFIIKLFVTGKRRQVLILFDQYGHPKKSARIIFLQHF